MFKNIKLINKIREVISSYLRFKKVGSEIEKIIQIYITMKPKLEAGKDLNKVMMRLTQTNEKNFTEKIDELYEKYKDFLEEITVNNITGELNYTHPRIRSVMHRGLTKV